MKKIFKMVMPFLVLLGGFIWFYRFEIVERIIEFYTIDWRPVACIALASAIAGILVGYTIGHAIGHTAGYNDRNEEIREAKRKKEEARRANEEE